MNKSEIVSDLAYKLGFTKVKVNEIIDCITTNITNEIQNSNKVNIVGFGYFEKAVRAPKVGRNPKTGEVVPIPSVTYVKFKASQKLKDKLNESVHNK